MIGQRTIRFKSRCGVTASWRIGLNRDGRFKALALSKPRIGRNPLPLDFVPFEMSDAVINGPSFETEVEAVAYVRSI